MWGVFEFYINVIYAAGYIISTMLQGQKKICKIVSGLSLRSTQPVPIGTEPALWNLLEAPVFTPEIQVYNILKYVSDKITVL